MDRLYPSSLNQDQVFSVGRGEEVAYTVNVNRYDPKTPLKCVFSLQSESGKYIPAEYWYANGGDVDARQGFGAEEIQIKITAPSTGDYKFYSFSTSEPNGYRTNALSVWGKALADYEPEVTIRKSDAKGRLLIANPDAHYKVRVFPNGSMVVTSLPD